MTIETVLDAIQNFRSQIDQWGVTAETLLAVAGLAMVMFILSLREVLTWFLRVHTLREEVKGLRADIAELKGMLVSPPVMAVEAAGETAIAPTEATPLKKNAKEKAAKAFRLDH